MEAYREGFLASANGKLLTDNPYPSNEATSWKWAQGWQAHKELRAQGIDGSANSSLRDFDKHIFSQGRQAAANGKTYDENPYSHQSAAHRSWHLGWRDLKEYRKRAYGESFIDPFPWFATNFPKENWLHETIDTSKHGQVIRVKSSIIYLIALTSFILGLVFFNYDFPIVGGILTLLVMPTLLLYPMLRFLFGGRGGAIPMAAAFVAQNVLKYKILKWLENKDRSR